MRDSNQIPSSPQSDFQGMDTIKSAAVDRVLFFGGIEREMIEIGADSECLLCYCFSLYRGPFFLSLCKTQSACHTLQRPLKDCSELWLKMAGRVPSSGTLNTLLSDRKMTKCPGQDNSFTPGFEEGHMKKGL